jgi:hypothetical protein
VDGGSGVMDSTEISTAIVSKNERDVLEPNTITKRFSFVVM